MLIKVKKNASLVFFSVKWNIMLLKIILLLTIIPLVELVLLLQVAQLTSVSFTILLVIGTGIIGGILAKLEGLKVMVKIQTELAQGRLPKDPAIEGAMILLAGALLLTPGIFTDLLGFSFLLPPSRNILREMIKKKMQAMKDNAAFKMNISFRRESDGFRPIHDEPPPGAPPLETDVDDDEAEE